MAKWTIGYKNQGKKLSHSDKLDLIDDFIDKEFPQILPDEYDELLKELRTSAAKGLIPTSVEFSDIIPKKKGPKNITPKTIDESAASFEKLEEPKVKPKTKTPFPNNIINKAAKKVGAGINRGIDSGIKKTSTFVEKGINDAFDTALNTHKKPAPKPSNIPDAEARLAKVKSKLEGIGPKLQEKAAAKKADFEKIYGKAVKEVTPKTSRYPSPDKIPFNPDYVKDSLGKAKNTLTKTGKGILEDLGQYQTHTDLMGLRLQDAAPKITPKEKPLGFAKSFRNEIPGRMEPPPIPGQAKYSKGEWGEFAKESPEGYKPNFTMVEPQGDQKLLSYKGVPTAAERMALTPKEAPDLSYLKKGGPSGGTIEGIEDAIQKMIKGGEKPISILKESATDAAKYMKKNKVSKMDLLLKGGKWLGLGVIAYELLYGNKAKALEMATEFAIPLPVIDWGDEGPSIENPPARSQIQDYVRLNEGLQG